MTPRHDTLFSQTPTDAARGLRFQYSLNRFPVDALRLYERTTQRKPLTSQTLEECIAQMRYMPDHNPHRGLYLHSGMAPGFQNYLAALALAAETMKLPGTISITRRDVADGATTVGLQNAEEFVKELLMPHNEVSKFYQTERFTPRTAAERFNVPLRVIERRLREFKFF